VLYFAFFVLRDAGVPFGIDFDVVRAIIVFFVVLLTLRTVEATGRIVSAHLALAAAGVLVEVVLLAADPTGLELVSQAISLYLLFLSALSLLVFLLRRERVSGDALVGALAVYLAVGVLFGMAYTTIAEIDPAAFDPPQVVSRDTPSPLFYFSYVTLTTLGYGDIGPAISATRILVALEAVAGVVLLAVLVGRIVGMLASQQSAVHVDRRLDALAQLIRGQEQGDPTGADPSVKTDDGGRQAPP
jgi:hypothetical protein